MWSRMESSSGTLPGSLAGLSTWKKPPWKSTISGPGGSAAWGLASRGRETSASSAFPADCEVLAASAACFFANIAAFMAAFAAARRDLPAAMAPAGLGAEGAAVAGFCPWGKKGNCHGHNNTLHILQPKKVGAGCFFFLWRWLIWGDPTDLDNFFRSGCGGLQLLHPIPGLRLLEGSKLFLYIHHLRKRKDCSMSRFQSMIC